VFPLSQARGESVTQTHTESLSFGSVLQFGEVTWMWSCMCSDGGQIMSATSVGYLSQRKAEGGWLTKNVLHTAHLGDRTNESTMLTHVSKKYQPTTPFKLYPQCRLAIFDNLPAQPPICWAFSSKQAACVEALVRYFDQAVLSLPCPLARKYLLSAQNKVKSVL